MDPEEIAKRLTDDPDILNENWDELGIEDPGLESDTEFEPIDKDPGLNWLLVFSPKNFQTQEQAIQYAQHCFGVDLSDGRQHAVKINDCELTVELKWNDE